MSESHTPTNAAVTKLSALVSKLARFGPEDADIVEMVKVALAQVKPNAVLLTFNETELADNNSELLRTTARMNATLFDEK